MFIPDPIVIQKTPPYCTVVGSTLKLEGSDDKLRQ